MFIEQRKSLILEELNNNGSVALNDLISMLGVSQATVRRDLTELERSGLLRRTHGGAVPTDIAILEAGYAEKENVNLEEKRSIAKLCASMVVEGDTVMLDSGTTTFEIARALRHKKITIITNSATIISDYINYTDSPVELVCTGGIFRQNFRCFVGSETENFIRRIIPDKVFIAANGFSVSHGASTPMLVEASVKRAMVGAGKSTYLVVDSSKMGNDYLSVIAPPEAFDGIITDSRIDKATVQELLDRGLEVITEKGIS